MTTTGPALDCPVEISLRATRRAVQIKSRRGRPGCGLEAEGLSLTLFTLAPIVPPLRSAALMEEDPERWDGLS
jgi:hypothetical protein